MVGLPVGTRIWLPAGVTDMRCGFNDLSAKVETELQDDPFSGQVFVFRGRRGDIIKLLWSTADGCTCYRSGWSGGTRRGVSSEIDIGPVYHRLPKCIRAHAAI